MAGRQPAPLQGEGSSRSLHGECSSRSESSFFLDHFLRRPSESSELDQELNVAAAAAAAAAAGSGSRSELPSPSNSIASLVSNYDDLLGANPWQYLSGTSDPSSPREYFNQQLTHHSYSSQLFSSSHFQRDLVAEYPWRQEALEQQQRAANSTQAHNQIQGDSRSTALDDVDCHKSSRSSTMGHAGTPSGSTQSANLQDTSLSCETDSDDDSDNEECTRSIDPPGSMVSDCNGKRKTPEVSGEEGDHDSTRISGSEADQLRRTSSSGPRKRSEANANVKLPREPRYAIKTRTDVDIMDDGFKWRKYGQKAVKNSPHPRNYYRCTTPHCPVRKRVERSHEDSGLVITTYEGKHTHLTPGADSSAGFFRESTRPRAGGSSLFQSSPPLPGSRQHEFSTARLAALHQMRALRSLQTLAQQYQIGQLPLPGSLQRDVNLLRAQHFLGLHDAASFGSVKQEPTFPFTDHDIFMASRSSSSFGSNLPYTGRHFLEGMQYWMLQQQMMPPARGDPPAPDPPHLRATQSNIDHIPGDLRPPPPTDGDLVRRALEAEEQEFGSGRAEINIVAAGSASQRRRQQPPREPAADHPLLNGLLQEMVDPTGSRSDATHNS